MSARPPSSRNLVLFTLAASAEARRVLRGNPHLPANYRLDVREADGGLRLSGKVDSYFHKQMAQESLRDLPGVTQIENLLEVLS